MKLFTANLIIGAIALHFKDKTFECQPLDLNDISELFSTINSGLNGVSMFSNYILNNTDTNLQFNDEFKFTAWGMDIHFNSPDLKNLKIDNLDFESSFQVTSPTKLNLNLNVKNITVGAKLLDKVKICPENSTSHCRENDISFPFSFQIINGSIDFEFSILAAGCKGGNINCVALKQARIFEALLLGDYNALVSSINPDGFQTNSVKIKIPEIIPDFDVFDLNVKYANMKPLLEKIYEKSCFIQNSTNPSSQ